MSSGIGRIKAGESYKRRQQSVEKGLLMTLARRGGTKLAEGDPQAAKVVDFAAKHRKGLVATGATTTTGATGLAGYKHVTARRAQKKQLAEELLSKHSDETTTLAHDMKHVREHDWSPMGRSDRVSAKSKKEKADLDGFTDRLRKTGIKSRKDPRKNKARYVAKADPLKTSISRDDAKRLSRQYGLKGPLPKGLDRNQKMAAYEARYVTSGGHKAAKWQHRADTSEKIRATGVGLGAAAGAAFLGSKAGAGRIAGPLARRTPLRHITRNHLETAGVGVGTVTAGAEVDAMRARKKRSSYASAPGGVAAGALRRLRAYTPEDGRG